MDIICSFYYSSNPIRQQELEYTLHKNLGNDCINNIHLFIEDDDYNLLCKSEFIRNNNYHKIKLIKYKGQPTYTQMFTYGSKLENVICCICNSDIEVVIEDYSILKNVYNENIIYFITRHEHDGSQDLIDDFGGSHDAFIFHSDTLKNKIEHKDLNPINYIQNTSGIEALLTIFFIEQLNYKILNPCFQIKLIHHHKSQDRRWQQSPNGNIIVGYTYPTPLNNSSWGVYNKHMIYPCRI